MAEINPRRPTVSKTKMSAVQCSVLNYGVVQCSAVQFSTVQCSAVQCSAVQCSAVQCSSVQVAVELVNTAEVKLFTLYKCQESPRQIGLHYINLQTCTLLYYRIKFIFVYNTIQSTLLYNMIQYTLVYTLVTVQRSSGGFCQSLWPGCRGFPGRQLDLNTGHCTVFTVQVTLYSVYSLQCTVYSVQC